MSTLSNTTANALQNTLTIKDRISEFCQVIIIIIIIITLMACITRVWQHLVIQFDAEKTKNCHRTQRKKMKKECSANEKPSLYVPAHSFS